MAKPRLGADTFSISDALRESFNITSRVVSTTVLGILGCDSL